MATYTITVTDHGDVPAVANGGVASIVVSSGASSGGSGGSGAVDSVNGHTGVVVLSASDVGADASGAAASAQTAAQAAAASYTDTTVAAEVTRADAAYQPADTDLAAIAALSTTTFGRALLALADAAALRTAAGLGTAATQASTAFDAAGAASAAQAASQPLDSDLTAIAALATTTFGRSLLTQADAAAARATLGAGTSSLALGTSSSTAKAGDYQPAAANISDATTIGRTVLTAADAAAVRAAIGAGTSSFDGAYSSLTGKPTLGTAAPLDVPASGDASSAQVVKGTDTRLTNARTPSSHAASHASAGSDPITIAESQVTNLTTDLATKAPAASPTFTGTVTVPTPTAADSSTKAASTAYVQGELTAKAPLASPTFTGTPAAPTVAGTADSTTKIATTAFVQAVAALLAPLASPALTGSPTAPTQTAGDASTKVATTAYVDSREATVPINAQTGTSYTLVLADAGKFVTMTNAAASTLTVPPNSSVAFPVGTRLEGAQLGAGQVTLTQGAGVTINGTPGLKVAAQYGTFGLLKTATDTWLAYGRLSA